jgi:hypothetical protein
LSNVLIRCKCGSTEAPLTDDESEEVMRLSGLLDGWTSEEPRT